MGASGDFTLLPAVGGGRKPPDTAQMSEGNGRATRRGPRGGVGLVQGAKSVLQSPRAQDPFEKRGVGEGSRYPWQRKQHPGQAGAGMDLAPAPGAEL